MANKRKLLEILKREVSEDDIMDASYDGGCLRIDIVLGIYNEIEESEIIKEIKEALK